MQKDQTQSSPSEMKSPEQLGRYLRSAAGFTLMELIVVSAIIGILATFAMPAYRAFIVQAKNARAMAELRLLETEIADYVVQNGTYPANLAQINRGTLEDPWGNLYIYNDFSDLLNLPRRYFLDRNTDFDLYSKGQDGATEEWIYTVGGTGNDDVLRLKDGTYIGTGAGWVGED